VPQDLAILSGTPERVSADVTRPADFVRASRELSACTRLIRRTGRINHTEAEIMAEVVAFDHAEALDACNPIDLTRLTPRQSAGLACVVCSVDYLLVAVPHRPIGRSGTGSQVFACSWTCAGGAA
jgi:hypothetical protein